MNSNLIFPMGEQYAEYLRDESKLTGRAESISFPTCEEDIRGVLRSVPPDTAVTIQGGRTGLAGGSVPDGGHLMNLGRMNRVLGCEYGEDRSALLTAEPGVTLLELEQEILRLGGRPPLFWPCAPSEESATVGGCAATNARGLLSGWYGDTRRFVEGVRWICADGSAQEAWRDSDEGLLNRLLGSEGAAGVFTRLTLRLIPKPACIWGLALFFESETDGAAFAGKVCELRTERAAIAAAEWMDAASIRLVEERKATMTRLHGIADIDTRFNCMVFLELHGEDEEAVTELAGRIMELGISRHSDPERAWALSGGLEVRKLRYFRHAAAESVNIEVERANRAHPEIVKLGADMNCPMEDFETVLRRYRSGLDASGLHGCIFGHIRDRNLHVNLLPETVEEYRIGTRLLDEWTYQAAREGGTVISEHGAGRLKKSVCASLSPEIPAWRARLRAAYDPQNRWNRGCLL